MITRVKKIQITPTVLEIAEAFCNMDADDQACFFNLVSTVTSRWKRNLCFQLQSVTDSKTLSNDGRNIMELIGQYSKKE